MMHKLETKIGNIWFSPTSGDHIFVDFGSNLNVAEEGPNSSQRRGPLTAYGVTVYGSMHLHRFWDGQFHLGWPSGPAQHYLYLSRGAGQDASLAARKLVINTVLPLVNEWAAANPTALTEADNSAKARRGILV